MWKLPIASSYGMSFVLFGGNVIFHAAFFPCLLIETFTNIQNILNADISALYSHARGETNKKHSKVTINSL